MSNGLIKREGIMNRDWTWQERLNDAKCSEYGKKLRNIKDRESLVQLYWDVIGDECNELWGFSDEKIRMLLMDHYQTTLEV